jgi:hypothetical protein
MAVAPMRAVNMKTSPTRLRVERMHRNTLESGSKRFNALEVERKMDEVSGRARIGSNLCYCFLGHAALPATSKAGV